MIVLEESVRLDCEPAQAWDWLSRLDENYPRWHPEHLAWRTIAGDPLEAGSIVFFDEWIGPHRVTGRSFIDQVEPGRSFSYRLDWPSRAVAARGSFFLRPSLTGATILHQQVAFGWRIPVVAALIDAILRLALPVNEVRRHMLEEQRNLAEILGPGRGRS